MIKNGIGLLLLTLITGAANGLELDRLRVQRKEAFEFTERPTVTREGDKVTVAFAVKDFCDAAVAVEDQSGRILRHAAAGVLGANAPEPFQKNALKQTIVWDGKDDMGRYVDDKDRCTVRVSLGLKPQMERALYWSAQRPSDGGYGGLKDAPEGVYVSTVGHGNQVRLFDHDGNYVRTVYPFPAEKIDRVQGLTWEEFPPNNDRLPSKLFTHDQDTFLSYLSGPSPEEEKALLQDKSSLALWNVGAKLASPKVTVAAGRVAITGTHVNRLATDGGSPGTDLNGPALNLPIAMAGTRNVQGGVYPVFPRSVAISPDGKWIYFSGYYLAFVSYDGQRGLHAVMRMPFDGKEPPTLFAGSTKQSESGNDNAHFKYAMSVACDGQGRVYVADAGNSRIQVFSPDGQYLKTIPTPHPFEVQVDRKTGEIYAGSWQFYMEFEAVLPRDEAPALRRFGPFDAPALLATYPMPVQWDSTFVGRACLVVDHYADRPRVWLSTGSTIKIYELEERALVLKRDFAADAQNVLARPRPAKFGRPRLWFNQANGMLYLGQITWDTPVACKSFYEVVRIDPKTGANRVEQMPTDAEDMGFDCDGHAYLRTYDAITRYDPSTWKEVPFDYGDQRSVYHGQGGGGERPFDSASAITLPSCIGGMFHMGGFGVSPQGNTVVSCINPNDPLEENRLKEKNVLRTALGKPYKPVVYPGRNMGWETHVYDPYGRSLCKDVAPGIGVSNMLQIDRDNNVYLLASSTPYLDGKPYFNGRGCTLIKLKPGKMKCISGGGPIPLPRADLPKRLPDMTRPGLWIEGAEWLFGPVGADGHYGSGGKCSCYVNARFALDYYGRSFAPEVDRFRVVVLDTNGNVITRIGRYGNPDDGVPVVREGGPATNRSIGGDEVAIMHAMNLAVDSDRRLFLADVGNQCIRSVKLDYYATEVVHLKDMKGGN